VAKKLKNGSSNSYRNIHACETSSDDEERNGLGSKPNSDFSGSQDMMAWQKAANAEDQASVFFQQSNGYNHASEGRGPRSKF
jgi:hypothetical protein